MAAGIIIVYVALAVFVGTAMGLLVWGILADAHDRDPRRSVRAA